MCDACRSHVRTPAFPRLYTPRSCQTLTSHTRTKTRSPPRTHARNPRPRMLARFLTLSLFLSLTGRTWPLCTPENPTPLRPLPRFSYRRRSGGLPWRHAGRRSPEFGLLGAELWLNFRFWSEEHGSERERCLSSDWGLQGGILGGIGELEAPCRIISWMDIDSPFSRWHKKVIVISWNFSLTICFGEKLSWTKYFRRKFWGKFFLVKR